MTTRIVVEHVDKTFTLHPQGGVKLDVLRNANLRVDAGECVALTGPSGTGKSTLLRCLYGNYGASTGAVWIFDRDRWVNLCDSPASIVRSARVHSLGWVSQFLRVIPRVSTLDVVCEPLIAQRIEPNEARDAAATLLSRLNVPERLWGLAPATFSGGEQQRVNLARGLVARHRILLVDEPTASLDPKNAAVVVELLTEARMNGASVVGIFHDQDVRNQVATRTVDVGQMTESQPTGQGNPYAPPTAGDNT
jgi:alpha-D-ribose 1-methylphosphonate 5-triphosphate synthase subunit PhnL